MTRIADFAALADLQRKLQQSPELAKAVAAKAAPRLTTLAQQAFGSQSVYGVPYPSGVDLHESGRLKSEATRYTAHGTKVRASVAAVRHARYQLKHGYLPAKGRVPAAWEAEIRKLAQAEIAKHFGGRR